jgi:hypothetical protein
MTYNMMAVWNWRGEIAIKFGSMNQPPFDSLERRRQFADLLETIPGSREFTDDELVQWPELRISRLVESGGIENFLQAWDWYLDQIPQ